MDKAEVTLLWGPIKSMPGDFSDADKKLLTAAYREIIEGQALPAFRKLRTFSADEYLPATRESVGLDKLPNGEQWYAFNAHQSTTTDMTPAEIHQLGLDEVARIHGAIRKVMTEAGFRSEEHTSELQSLMRTSYAVFCFNKIKNHTHTQTPT